MVIAAAPGLAATPKPELPEPESPWTKPTKVEAPSDTGQHGQGTRLGGGGQAVGRGRGLAGGGERPRQR
ncbi:hypothetical protein R2F25_00245 [Streptomyces sp. UP1A-1]|nr:hypothetical protein [Streptomyces sp. UP1A-1]